MNEEDPYDALTMRYAKQLAESMQRTMDTAIVNSWGALDDLDEIYEQDFPEPEEEIK